ncbi:unnamed protein product [Prunus armeniaca]
MLSHNLYHSSNPCFLAAARGLTRCQKLRLPTISSSKTKGKGKVTHTVPKRRSMRILQTRFASTCKDKGEGYGPDVIVTIDDDDDSSDESGAAKAEISTHGQESTHCTSGMDEDPDEDQYYSCDEDTYPDFDTLLEEPDA